jgi:hypothetical protein
MRLKTTATKIMSDTFTNSESDSYTESRALYVMGKVYDDFHSIAGRGFTGFSSRYLTSMKEDIFYLMTQKVLKMFQIQFTHGSKEWAVEYTVSSDGSIQVDRDSGGIDYWQIPQAASLRIVARWDRSKSRVEAEMERRGWTGSASWVTGKVISDGGYSKSGFGLYKNRIGSWETE